MSIHDLQSDTVDNDIDYLDSPSAIPDRLETTLVFELDILHLIKRVFGKDSIAIGALSRCWVIRGVLIEILHIVHIGHL